MEKEIPNEKSVTRETSRGKVVAVADEDNDGKSFSMEEKKENARRYNEGIERILV